MNKDKSLFAAMLIALLFGIPSPAKAQLTLNCEPNRGSANRLIVPQNVQITSDLEAGSGRISDSVLKAIGQNGKRLKDVSKKGNNLLLGYRANFPAAFLVKARLQPSRTGASFLYRIDQKAMTYRLRVLYGNGFNQSLSVKGTCQRLPS